MKRSLIAIFILATSGSSFGQGVVNKRSYPKLSIEEIVSKHISSIGTPEAIAAVKSRIFIGKADLTKIKAKESGPTLTLNGTAQFASLDSKMLFAIVFDSPALPYEKFAFDGSNITIGRPSEVHTELIGIPKSHSWIVKEGLFGGTLSASWPLLKFAVNRSRLDYSGMEKVGGRDYYKIKYTPTSGDGSRVAFFIDAETFELTRTVYVYHDQFYLKVPDLGTTSVQEETTWTEEFADYRHEGALSLPHLYTLSVRVGNYEIPESKRWAVNFIQFYFNEPLETSVFKVS